MVELSDAGARLAACQPDDPRVVGDIFRMRNRRRHRRRLAMGAAALTIAAGVGAGLVVVLPGPSQHTQQVTTNSLPGTPGSTDIPSATADQLAAGHWSVLPPAPIPARENPVVVWTGREIIVWGGQSGPNDNVVNSDGASYTPTTRKWVTLPPAPISGRVYPAAVWTGQELVIWGGYDSNNPQNVSANGAAYDPEDNRWTLLAASPLSPRAQAQAVWTGQEVFILGGNPAVITSQHDYDTNGALYDPATNAWQTVPAPSAPAGHGLDWTLAVQAGSQTLAWSPWYITTSIGSNATSTTAGFDFYSYYESSGYWRALSQNSDPVKGPTQAIWTGHDVVVRGGSYFCGPCSGPASPEVSALLNPVTGSWTSIPTDPIALDQPTSAWTGQSLASVDLGARGGSAQSGSISPGDATAYDPDHQRWLRLPTPPSVCTGYAPPIWTGHQMIVTCVSSVGIGSKGSQAAGGIALTPGP
jgi:hypothetical protein